MFAWIENALVFHPPPRRVGGEADNSPFENAFFTASDGVRLHGWYAEHPQPRAVVLFCHANAEDVFDLADFLEYYARRFRVSLLAFDYRGYGRSQGRPNEAGVMADGEAARAWLARRARVPPERIVLMGRSLGGAVATHVAARGGARGLVLDRVFSSLPDVAAWLYPWAPVRWLMPGRYDACSHVARYAGPLLQVHGDADEIIPLALARRLYDAAPGAHKTFVRVPDLRHNDALPELFYETLDAFLDGLPSAPAGASDPA